MFQSTILQFFVVTGNAGGAGPPPRLSKLDKVGPSWSRKDWVFGCVVCVWPFRLCLCCPKPRAEIAAPVGRHAGRSRPAELQTAYPARLADRGKQRVVGAAERPDSAVTSRSERAVAGISAAAWRSVLSKSGCAGRWQTCPRRF